MTSMTDSPSLPWTAFSSPSRVVTWMVTIAGSLPPRIWNGAPPARKPRLGQDFPHLCQHRFRALQILLGIDVEEGIQLPGIPFDRCETNTLGKTVERAPS